MPLRGRGIGSGGILAAEEPMIASSGLLSWSTSLPADDDEDGGLYEVPVMMAAAEDRFFRTGSANPGTLSGLRIFLIVWWVQCQFVCK